MLGKTITTLDTENTENQDSVQGNLITKKQGKFEFNVVLLVKLLNEAKEMGRSQQDIYDSKSLESILKSVLLNLGRVQTRSATPIFSHDFLNTSNGVL